MLSSLSASLMMMTRMSRAMAKSILRIVSAACTVLFLALSAARRDAVLDEEGDAAGRSARRYAATRVARAVAASAAVSAAALRRRRALARARLVGRPRPRRVRPSLLVLVRSALLGRGPRGRRGGGRRPPSRASSPRPMRMSATRRSCIQAASPEAPELPARRSSVQARAEAMRADVLGAVDLARPARGSSSFRSSTVSSPT